MNDKIKEEEVNVLKEVSMEYPTWNEIKGLLGVTFKDPVNSFGNKPIQRADNTLVPVTVLNSNIVGGDFAGIDVPVLLKPDTNINGKTIVIVGESPLRDANDPNNPKIVLLGTPYAVHQEFDAPSQCNVYKKIFTLIPQHFDLTLFISS